MSQGVAGRYCNFSYECGNGREDEEANKVVGIITLYRCVILVVGRSVPPGRDVYRFEQAAWTLLNTWMRCSCMRDAYLGVIPDIRTVQARVPTKVVQLQPIPTHINSPCFDSGRRCTGIRADGRTSVSGSRRDRLRAGLGITIAQSRYAYR